MQRFLFREPLIGIFSQVISSPSNKVMSLCFFMSSGFQSNSPMTYRHLILHTQFSFLYSVPGIYNCLIAYPVAVSLFFFVIFIVVFSMLLCAGRSLSIVLVFKILMGALLQEARSLKTSLLNRILIFVIRLICS